MTQKILMIGPAWVGDMVMAHSLFRYLHDKTQAEIHVLAPGYTTPLLECMPEVAKAIPVAFPHGGLQFQARLEMGRALRAEAYDQAIVLPNSWKSAFIPLIAGIPKRTGWLGEFRYGLLNDARKLDKSSYPLMVQRFLALADAKGTPALQTYPRPQFHVRDETLQATREQFLGDDKAPILALCPGAEYGPAKQWPSQHFGELANMKMAEGVRVVIVGSPKEQAVAQEIQGYCQNRCIDLTGKTNLAQAIAVLANADAVVSNDSGLMHIAAALNRPLVALYGSSSPDFTPPLSDHVAILANELACRPCFKRVCPLGHLDCLTKIAPLTVHQRLEELLR